MTIVYLDEYVLLNVIVDYLLLSASAALAGQVMHRGRMLLAAIIGGGFAACTLLPGWAFLRHPACGLALGAGLCLIAYGSSPNLLKVSLVFLGVASAFGGGMLILRSLSGVAAVPDLKATLLSAAICYCFLTLIFRRSARHSGSELVPAELILGGRRCRLTALIDTGNTLTDPATGRPVLVAEGAAAASLFPDGEAPAAGELADPVAAITGRREKGRWRLIPYRSVGVSHGLLLALRVDGASIGGTDEGPILVALSPGPLSDGGGYNALIGTPA